MKKLIINTDGGSRGNPGPSAVGVVIKNIEGTLTKELATYIGVGTNNNAEYSALIAALTYAKEEDPDELECLLDSELVVKQLNGQYKVKDPSMKILYTKVKDLEKGFKKVIYKNIPRAENAEADLLVNQVLDAIESENAQRKS